MQDEILTRLAKVADLKVISRTSTQKYKSAPDNLRDVARELGVANILEGSVQKSKRSGARECAAHQRPDRRASLGRHFRPKLTDIFAVESEIAKTIADTLQAKLTGSEERAIAARPTENPEAYELYLERPLLLEQTHRGRSAEIDRLLQSGDRERSELRAGLCGFGSSLGLPGYNGGAPKDCFPQAEAAAKKALSLDDDSADAHAARLGQGGV